MIIMIMTNHMKKSLVRSYLQFKFVVCITRSEVWCRTRSVDSLCERRILPVLFSSASSNISVAANMKCVICVHPLRRREIWDYPAKIVPYRLFEDGSH